MGNRKKENIRPTDNTIRSDVETNMDEVLEKAEKLQETVKEINELVSSWNSNKILRLKKDIMAQIRLEREDAATNTFLRIITFINAAALIANATSIAIHFIK